MTSGPPDVVVSARGVAVHRGRREVLHGVDLQVAAGEVVALLGPNGAGKSTLLATLSGALAPSAGQVHRVGRVATVLQSPALAQRSALANVELALSWWGVPRGQRRARATEALARMRAGHLARRPGYTLSGGEQRRVHLARAIAVAPALLLLDEPFDGLDPQSHESLREDTSQVLREAASAVVVVLHDRADAWAMADRLVVLTGGRVRADGPPQQVLDRPPSAEVAELLGYDGRLHTGSGVLLTRPVQVRIDAGGELPARVLRIIAVEDGARLEVDTGRGVLWARHDAHDVRVGDDVRLHIRGGAQFPGPQTPGHP